MQFLTVVRNRIPGFVKRLYGRGGVLWIKSRCLPRFWIETLAVRLISADVQRFIPTLSARLKILPSMRISLITTCGNRLKHLQESLPTYLAQDWSNLDVIVSVYADRQGTANYVRDHFADSIKGGRLTLIETPAKVFNKACAVNIAVENSQADYLFLVDCDCLLDDTKVLIHLVRQFNLRSPELASFYLTGQILLKRDRFIEIGGFDVSLRDVWAPDDADFIVRYVVYYGVPYVYLNQFYTRKFLPIGRSWQIVQDESRRHDIRITDRWERHPSQTQEALLDTKFFKRIGGPKKNTNEIFAAQLKYFETADPKITYRTTPIGSEGEGGRG